MGNYCPRQSQSESGCAAGKLAFLKHHRQQKSELLPKQNKNKYLRLKPIKPEATYFSRTRVHALHLGFVN